MDMKILQVLDRLIPYDAFLNDLAARIVGMIKADSNDPEFVSQRKAYELFGRRNVERWKRQGKADMRPRWCLFGQTHMCGAGRKPQDTPEIQG